MSEPPRPPTGQPDDSPHEPTLPLHPSPPSGGPGAAPPPPPPGGAPHPPPGAGAPPPGSPPQAGYGAPPPGHAAPQGYSAPPQPGHGPPPPYGPPPGGYPASGPYAAGGYGGPHGYASAEERSWALVAHFGGAAIALLSAGWLGWIAPLVALMAKGQESPTVRAHAVEALNFQLTWGAASILAGIAAMCLFVLVIPLAFPFLTGAVLIVG
ncbi:MAG TPA: DUF4870 domain-containing protein, partial [Pilimelia sp.]|nr:DUF4870 domain-containing protein [Pilimelia sp.]